MQKVSFKTDGDMVMILEMKLLGNGHHDSQRKKKNIVWNWVTKLILKQPLRILLCI